MIDDAPLSPSPVRHRTEAKLALRAGRAAIAPLSRKLIEWHGKTALFGARLDRMLLRGELKGDILPEIEALALQVESELSAWRDALEGEDATGRVDDAEQAGRTILATLRDLRRQAYEGLR